MPRLIEIWCSGVIRQEKEKPGSLSLGGFSNRCKEELRLSSLFVCFEAGSNGLGEDGPNEWPWEAMIGDRTCHTDGRATEARKRADGSGATKKPKEDGLEDRGPKGGEDS